MITTRSARVQEILEHSRAVRERVARDKNWEAMRVQKRGMGRLEPVARAAGGAGRPLWDVLPDGSWFNQPCFIIGGGPSLKGFEFERLRGAGRVVAINKAFKDAPFADVLFAMDYPFLEGITQGKFGEEYRLAFMRFLGMKVWVDLSGYGYPEDIFVVPSAGEHGWTKSLKDGLCHGQNSGYGALNLAIVLGANPIFLLGYDMKKGPEGATNYHEGYTTGISPDALEAYRKNFEEGAALLNGGPRIINLNTASALRCFEFSDVDVALRSVIKSAPEKADAAYFDGCLGFGDNFQQRPLIRDLLKTYKTVYLRTALPELYWDIPGVRFVDPGKTGLRTQDKHLAGLPANIWAPLPADIKTLHFHSYPPHSSLFPRWDEHPNDRAGSRQLSVSGYLRQQNRIEDYDFFFPVRTAWVEAARKVVAGLDLKGKKLCLVRPPTRRPEWDCPSRNPKIEYVQLLIDRYKDEYFFVSVGDVDGEDETYDGELRRLDAVFDRGEIPLTSLFGLLKIADMSIIYPGFFMPAAIAIRAKCFTIFGGNAGPQVHVDPVMGLQNFGWIAPEPFCQCFNNFHECRKDIPEERIISSFEELRKRPRWEKCVTIGSAPGLGDNYWLMTKMESFRERNAIDRLRIAVHEDPVHKYTADFLSLIPFIDEVERRPGQFIFPFSMAGGPGTPCIKNSHGCDYIMELGSRLSEGDRLEEILPEYETNFHPRIDIPEADVAWADDFKRQVGGKLFLFFTASVGGNRGWNKECWKVADWIRLAELIHGATGIKPTLIGATWDMDYAEDIRRQDRQQLIRQGLVGQTSIARALALLRGADLLAGFSCGIPMVATYFGVPTILFWPIRGISRHEYYKPGFMTSWIPRDIQESGRYFPVPYNDPETNPEAIFAKVRRFL